MENHRTVLVESMKEYFTRIEHKLVGKYQMKDKKQKRMNEAELELEISKYNTYPAAVLFDVTPCNDQFEH